MPEQPHCPDRPSLERLLAGTLPDVEQDAVAHHVEGCSRCQRTLEVLAGTSWSDEVRRLGGGNTEPEPALNQVIDRALCRDATEVTQAGPPANTDELSFLEPSSTPGHLGRLGRCEVLEVLGKGGFGTVLRALDEKLRRIVAIKVLAPELAASGTARKRFIREAQAAAAVKNDHVVAIYNVEDEHNPPYLVMELIEGITLQGRLDKDGPLQLKEILRIGMQMAEGLAAAHKQGLVHRDIKPANILLENGVERVKITDFGLARAVDDASLTQSGVVAGTPMYMSPEQAEGQAIDHRSDLFSLGTVLYAMSTGRPPFRATGTIAVLKRVVEETPRPIREINPDIPGWLADIIAKLHAKKPADRYQTAKEVAELLGRKLAELQMHGRSGVGQVSSPPAAPRSRRRVALALALLLLAGIGAAITFWPRGDFEPPDTRGNQGDKPLPKPPVVNAKPFVILARDKRAEQKHPTLAAAVASAQSGDTIEIRGDGPFATGPIDLQKKALAIRAGSGFKPHLKYQPTDPKSKAPWIFLLKTEAPLVLEGLILERAGNPEEKGWEETSIVYTSHAPLLATHCRLVGIKIQAALILEHSPSASVQNSEILGSNSYLFHGISFFPVSSSRLSLENNLIVANFHPIRFGQFSPKLEKATILVRHNTMLDGVPFTFDYGPSLEQLAAAADAKEPGLALEVTGNILTGGTGPAGVFDFKPLDKSVPLEKTVALLPKLVSFQDKQNLYALREQNFLETAREGAPAHPSLHSLAEWNKYWKIAKPTSQVGTPVYQGGDVFARTPDQLTPADFRLVKNSPGKGKGPGGKDVGADVDRVGPGKPYDEWKKTPEYTEWQKKTAEMMAATTQPFVLLARDGKTEQKFPTLKDAVEKAQSGDTIEIRGNGPFVGESIKLNKKALTIRAGSGYRPVLRREWKPGENVWLWSNSTLVLEGLEFQSSKTEASGHTIVNSSAGALRMANCRLLEDGKAHVIVGYSSLVEIINCQIAGNAGGVGWNIRFPSRLLMDNCLLTSKGATLFLEVQAEVSRQDLSLRNSTALSPLISFRFWKPRDLEPLTPNEPPVRLDVAGVVLAQRFRAITVDWREDTAAPEEKARLLLKRFYRWSEQDNLYSVRPTFGAIDICLDERTQSRTSLFANLKDWQQFWGTGDAKSIEGNPIFQGGDLLARLADDAQPLQPADFRLADGSPGKGAGPGGKDIGADVDKVGPGKPYEEWKKTDEYKEWRKKVEKAMEPAK